MVASGGHVHFAHQASCRDVWRVRRNGIVRLLAASSTMRAVTPGDGQRVVACIGGSRGRSRVAACGMRLGWLLAMRRSIGRGRPPRSPRCDLGGIGVEQCGQEGRLRGGGVLVFVEQHVRCTVCGRLAPMEGNRVTSWICGDGEVAEFGHVEGAFFGVGSRPPRGRVAGRVCVWPCRPTARSLIDAAVGVHMFGAVIRACALRRLVSVFLSSVCFGALPTFGSSSGTSSSSTRLWPLAPTNALSHCAHAIPRLRRSWCSRCRSWLLPMALDSGRTRLPAMVENLPSSSPPWSKAMSWSM